MSSADVYNPKKPPKFLDKDVASQYRPADELTLRAREAVVAANIFPGSAELVRAGLSDDTYAVIAARQALVDKDKPVEELQGQFIYYAVEAPVYGKTAGLHPLQKFVAWLLAPAMRYYARRLVKEQKGTAYREAYEQRLAQHRATLAAMQEKHRLRMQELSMEAKETAARLTLKKRTEDPKLRVLTRWTSIL